MLTCFCFLSASVNQRVVTHLVSVMEFRVFFDVLPYALRNEELRKRMARAYDWYRQTKLDWLTAADESSPSQQQALLGLAELMTAVVDGLAIQEAIDDGFDTRRPFAVLEFMLQRSLADLLDLGLRGGELPK